MMLNNGDPVESHDHFFILNDMIGLIRSHVQIHFPYQVVLFKKKQEYFCIKLVFISFVGYGSHIFHKIGNERGGELPPN